MKIRLSSRLQAVANMVPHGRTVADIGTDHGYLPTYLVVENISVKAIASDSAKGPLAAAKQLVELLGLNNQIETRLGSGLTVLQPGEADVVCISGMGGATICDIIRESLPVAEKVERFVLQPQRNIGALRRFLMENGFCIVDEDLACDDGFFYEILAVEHGQMNLSDIELEYGPVLLANKHPLLGDYLELKYNDLKRLTDDLSTSPHESAKQRRADMLRQMEDMAAILKTLQC